MIPGLPFKFNCVEPMSKTDAQKYDISEKLKNIYSLAKKTGQTLPFAQKWVVPPMKIPQWLAGIDAAEKWYWQSRDGNLEIAGAGTCLVLSEKDSESARLSLREFFKILPDDGILLFSSRYFNSIESPDNIWDGFQECTYSVPMHMLIRQQDKWSYINNHPIDADSDIPTLHNDYDITADLTESGKDISMSFSIPKLNSKEHHPDNNGWHYNVEKILDAISAGTVTKTVLARRTDYHFDENVDPFAILALLKKQNKRCYAILHQPQPGVAFISLSPERLYKRKDNRIEIDALSSTVPRGETPDEDKQLENQLLTDDKLLREHQAVIDGVVDSIDGLTDQSPVVGKTEVLKLDRIQHLSTPITAKLQKRCDDLRIINFLHPTPAVGGTPRGEALRLISDLEPFGRGWYAAPIGYMTLDNAEFAVGIRSLLVRGKTVSVFSGGGIVDGSDPESEWDEIESKDVLKPLLNMLEKS